ncbi:UDP-N-acetylmuramate dehydrogenase [uncultured Paraglaciecola sp.]|uniref:UDP-N-acetylmuramate dehydrogenase n=1 Tax=uncultured Paraglaciecola sp. TaxID=1765024 RepID=UPI0030D7BFD2|tara:strand:- start:66222 stop:67238 length:1017 start_codon:yes stop_codon:yes gene_type:complete
MDLDAVDYLPSQIIAELYNICPDGVAENVALCVLSRWKVGGVAKCIVSPRSATQIASIIKLMTSRNLPYIVLGSTSNLLFDDEGLDVLAIQIGQKFSSVQVDNTIVTCQSGTWVPGFAKTLMHHSLTGVEHIAGIPGTIGGLICMNGGSQRKGIGEHINYVDTITSTGDTKRYSKEECKFSYRTSTFQDSDDIIVGAQFTLAQGKRTAIRQEMLGILSSRRKKFPQKHPNCGSVFVSNPAMYEDYGPPGAVIEQCNLKGVSRGGACISPLHANFIVNNHNASAADILYLIYLARETVRQKTGYEMPAEARYISANGAIIPAHIKAEQLWDSEVQLGKV